jgi:hypothetical protein
VTAVEEQQRARPEDAAAPVYVYGVVRAGAAVPDDKGVLGERVTLVTSGDVAALVSPVSSERVRAKRRDLLAHSDVLQAAHANGVDLPLGFGMVFTGEADVRTRFLEPRHDELVSLLAQYDGLSEMRLRVSYHDRESILAAVVAGDREIAALRDATRDRRVPEAQLIHLGEVVAKRYEARRAADADAVVGRLAERAIDVRVDANDDELTIAKASFLFRNRDRRAFDELLDSVALGSRHLIRFSCTGPLAPHSFVSLAGNGGA